MKKYCIGLTALLSLTSAALANDELAFAEQIQINGVSMALKASSMTEIPDLKIIIIEKPVLEFDEPIYGHKTYIFDWVHIPTAKQLCNLYGFKPGRFNNVKERNYKTSTEMPLVLINEKGEIEFEGTPYLSKSGIESIECKF